MGNTTRYRLEQIAVSASFEARLSPRWTLAGALGGIVAGQLVGPDGTSYRAAAGGVGSFSASFTALEQGKYWPFIMLSGSLAVGLTNAQPTLYLGIDGRLGVAVGYTFFDRLTPYVTGRVFGGPVIWNGDLGTDLFHYQVGGGLVLGLPAGFDVSVEAIPLGEQRITAGVGYSF